MLVKLNHGRRPIMCSATVRNWNLTEEYDWK